MDRELMRTSVTVDEAVAILLGWADEPTEFRPLNDNLSQEEQEIHDSLTYSLQEDLANDKEQAESDLAEAILDKMDEYVIETKREAVQKTAADRARAKTYLCAIEDEINKGPMSALRVDIKRTNSNQTYITLTSFDAWAEEKKFRGRVLEPVPAIIPPSVEADADNTGLGDAERRTRQEAGSTKQRRFDALSSELAILLPTISSPTPSRVMAELRKRVGAENTVITANIGDALQWEDGNGNVRKLTTKALAERIRVWKSRLMQG